MKKVLLNLISIDIKDKLLKYYKYITCIILFLVFNACDNIQAPTWQTQINLPLLSSEFLFSDMIGEDIINNKDSIITIVYEQDSMFPNGSLPLGDFNSYFQTPSINLAGTDSDLNDYVIDPISFEISSTIIDISQDFNADAGFCIPEDSIVNILNDIDIGSENIPISFGQVQETIDEIFENWSYATIGDAILDLDEDINLFFPTTFTYQVIGHEDDMIFNNNVFNELGPTRVFDNIIFVLDLSYNPNNESNEFIGCTQQYFIDGNPSNLDPSNLGEYTGWEFDPSKTTISMGGENSNFTIDSIESINGTTKEQTIIQSNAIAIPSIDGEDGAPFNILGGVVSDNNTNVNSMDFSITNSSSFPDNINFSLKLLNFKQEDNMGNYNQVFQINKIVPNDKQPYAIDDDGDFSGSKFGYYYDAGCSDYFNLDTCSKNKNCEWNGGLCSEVEVANSIDSLYMNIEINVISETGDIDINNMFDFSISPILINPIEFDAITTEFTHDFNVDIPEFEVPAAPEGSNIEGLQIVDPVLNLNIGNPFDIDNTLILELTSIIDGNAEEFNISADLGYGENQITIKGETCTNEIYYNDIFIGTANCLTYGNDINKPYHISSFLQSAPESITFAGSAVLGGTGTIGPDEITGGFGLELPFSFIIGTEIDGSLLDVNLVPETSTLLTPVSDETYESISNSLEEAALISNITNNSPIVGIVSMLVSTDDSFFPSYLDEIINVNNINYSDCIDGTCTYVKSNSPTFDQSIKVLREYSQDGFHVGSLLIDDIHTIKFTPMSEIDFRVKILKLITNDSHLLIGRLAMLELPCPTIDSYGNVEVVGEDSNYSSSMDSEQISLINFTESDKNPIRYLNTLMTLVNSQYPDCPNPNNNPDGVINLLSTHYINIQSYASFMINLGDY